MGNGRGVWWIAVTACWILVACAGSEVEPTAGVAVVDSGGTRIVRHAASAVSGAPALAIAERLRIGSLDGPEETQFYRLWDARRIGEEFHLLDTGHAEVRVFALDGTYRRRYGGQGDGPGEFTAPTAILALGDTVAVVDQRRITLFDAEGGMLSTFEGRRFEPTSMLIHVEPRVGGALGRWRTRRSADVDPGRPYRETETWTRMARSGAVLDTLFAYDFPEERLSSGPLPFNLSPYFADRPASTVGDDGFLYYTPGRLYRIERIDPTDGAVTMRIESELLGPRVTPAMVEAAAEKERADLRARPNPETEAFAAIIDEKMALPVPETRPLFGRIHVSPNGSILALRDDLDPDPLESGEDPSSWDSFASDGRLQGRLVLPPNTTVLSLDDEGPLVLETDALDVQSFVWYVWR